MSLPKACEPTCDGPSQRSPAISLKTTFWDASGGRLSLESAFSTQSSRLHPLSVPHIYFVTALCAWIYFTFLLYAVVCVWFFLSFFVCVVYMCLRRGRSLALWAGTSAMSLTTVTGSVLYSTSTSTAKMAPSLGTLSSTSLVGKPTHMDVCVYCMYLNACRVKHLGVC